MSIVSAGSGRVIRAPCASARTAVAVGLVVLLLAGVLGRILDYGISRDEMLFVPPAVLLGEWRLYADFFYNHVPLSAWMFRASHLLAPDAGILVAARLVVFAGWMLLIAATYVIVVRLSRSRLFAFYSVIALLTNDVLLGSAGMVASNNLLPLPFVVLGLGFFLMAVTEDNRRGLMAFLSGLLLVLGVATKVSGAVFVPPVLLTGFLLPRSLTFGTRLRTLVLPGVAGGLLGALPILVYLLPDPERFLAHVMGFHTGPHVAYWNAFRDTEPGLAIDFGGKLLLAYDSWLSGTSLLLCVGVMGTLWIASGSAVSRDRLRDAEWGPIGVMLVVLALAAAMSFVPTPGFSQYYVLPLVCLPLIGALAIRGLGDGDRDRLVPLLGSAIVFMIVLAIPRLAGGYLALAAPEWSEASKFAEGGRTLRDTLSSAGGAVGPVATFMPLYPLEGGLPVYPEFATGQFAYRVAQFTPPDLARQFVMVGADGLSALFGSKPPAAFLLGFEPELEEPLLRYAEQNGYVETPLEGVENRYGKARLLVRGPAEAD